VASRDLTVKARIVADTKDAERNLKATAAATQTLETRLTELRAKFDAGGIAADKFVRQQAALERQLSKLSKPADQGSSSLAKLTQSALGVAAGVVGVTSLVDVLRSVVSASAEQEAAINHLRVALGSLGSQADSVVASLKAQAEELQNTTTFADEAVNSAQARIAAYSKEKDVIEILTRASADLAAARGEDLVQTADKLGRAFASEQGSLKKLGIEVEGAAGSYERLRSISEGVANQAGGQAAAKLDTATGAWARLKNAVGEAGESLGDYITKNSAVKATVDAATVVAFLYADTFADVKSAQDAASSSADEQAKATERQKAALDALAAALAKINSDALEYAATLDRLTSTSHSEIDASNDFQATLKRLGVTLESEVNNRLQQNADALELARDEYARGNLSAAEFEQIQTAVANAAAGVATATRNATGAISESTDAVSGAATETLRWSSALQTLIPASSSVNVEVGQMIERYRGVREEIGLTTTAFDKLAAAQGRASAANANVAAGGTTTSAGTRSNLIGGSRLTSDPGLTGRTVNYTPLGRSSSDRGTI
jgi:hypothetical protein